MLKLTIAAPEYWDEQKQEFVYGKETTLQLEHSLVSLSKWESKWKKPFLGCDLTFEETIDYIRCMTATKPRKDESSKRVKEPITAEILYSDMINLGIPFECQKWHLSRLITLIRVCDIRSRPPKKLKPGERQKQYAAINAARRKQWNTKG